MLSSHSNKCEKGGVTMSHKHSNQTEQKAITKSKRMEPEFSNEFVTNQAPQKEHYKQPKKNS